MENKKEKYFEYYKTGKLNIINFINDLKSEDCEKLIKEICEEEKGLLSDLKLKQQKLQSVSKANKNDKIEDIKFDIDWLQKRLEFVKIKKDIVQRELQDNEIQR